MNHLKTIMLSFTIMSAVAGAESISLKGDWKFKLDPEKVGIKEQWFKNQLPDKAILPGSLDEQKLGIKNDAKEIRRLTRENKYIGPAWYQKKVDIPEKWDNKRIVLFLERAMWETKVYVDGIYIETQNSLSVPHVYDLTDSLTPGEHEITICVDNTIKINIGHTIGGARWAHIHSEEAQTSWNGIIGEIELIATPKVWIESVQTYPDFEKKVTKVKVTIGNITGEKVDGKLNLEDLTDNVSVKNIPFSAVGKETVVETELPFATKPTIWDEFSPKLHELKVKLEGRCPQRPNTHAKNKVAGDGDPPSPKIADLKTIKFSPRDFRANGRHFDLNGRTVYLRGRADSAVFPLTGYPPMTVEEWRRILNIYKDYGLNHVRFHSWCPPEAAFIAADELGFFFQIEPPLWDGHGLVGSIPERAAFILAEANRIVDTYGNHPSFCLMSMGNELGKGDDPYLAYLVDYLKKKDPRHLYSTTTHPPNKDRKLDDYFVGAGTKKGVCRGIQPFKDFNNSLADFKRPLIAHELGQPAMYPNFKEISKYTGPLKARYLDIFKKTLEDHKMLDQAEAFRLASGALLVEIYKENVEAQLRTSSSAGFQLLDILDYPGHGMATIGILDVFLDSKGLITPDKFREFCSETVPLIRTRSFTWNNDEIFKATGEVTHYGKTDLKDAQFVWTIKNKEGKTFAEGKFDKKDVPTGKTTQLGEIDFNLNKIKIPQQLVVEVSMEGRCPQRPKNTRKNKVVEDGDTPVIANSWKIWVYPSTDNGSRVTDHGLQDVTISTTWDAKTKEALQNGEKVLLLPDSDTLENVEKSRWHSVFWSYQLFKQPVTMGILCDPKHPALAEFPTDFFGDWQWHDILQNSEALIIDEVPAEFLPIVQFVPDFNNNKKLSAIFEAKVGKGKLIVSTLDLQRNIENRRDAKQLLSSLLSYMKSDEFNPKNSLDEKTLNKILKPVPQAKNRSGKPDTANASLYVAAAAHAPFSKPDPWKTSLDEVIVKKDGFDYNVEGKVWHQGNVAAWHNQHLVIEVDCPKDFEGDFYAFFNDFDGQGRGAALFFCGTDLGPISRYDKDGIWLKLPVTSEMAKTGKLRLDARVTKGPNVTVSQIALIPKNNK